MHTEASLTADLRALGVPTGPGAVLIVHSGFRSLGKVEGGPAAVARALVAAVAPGGTLIAPTFTNDLVDPYTWPVPPPAEERRRILETMEPFEPQSSPPHKMGAIATALWRYPGARRSLHPVTSWVAIGPRAEELTADHPLNDPEGIDGPVGRAYRADARVLLLGVDHDADTTVHLAESLMEMPHLRVLPDLYPARAADGSREWRAVAKTTKCSDGFVKLGPVLERSNVIHRGRVGQAECQLLRSRDIVRVVCELLAGEPAALLCDDPGCVHCPASRAALAGWRAPEVELLP